MDEVLDFGLRLKALRQKMNLSQQALAQRLEISKESVYRCESPDPQLGDGRPLSRLAGLPAHLPRPIF
ncbi:helix-turn-helix domain-containing protein [Bittarella massiliensis (ex Durand et al. 2017)]|uniref:helix-turn-helix domain-containing protein n=1 Tax=Bittarella massiliensis (ex Durand et al. 2017) TaxID=1720313 RepID=UPI001AA1048E|nr:helix-turn-helix transcriptional regulator [Bittarella massiliensis (ex Durand et al. 2017)]MBO1679590.1 helix-turn-helix domain-containing protein [Bittarella massiliensis (ex Durand et al. 2017)]